MQLVAHPKFDRNKCQELKRIAYLAGSGLKVIFGLSSTELSRLVLRNAAIMSEGLQIPNIKLKLPNRLAPDNRKALQ